VTNYLVPIAIFCVLALLIFARIISGRQQQPSRRQIRRWRRERVLTIAPQPNRRKAS